MSSRGPQRSSAGVGWQLAVVVGLVVGAVAIVVGYGSQLAHDLREEVLWLTPPRALVVAVGVILVLAGWSIAVGPRLLRKRNARASPPVLVLLGLVVVTAAMFRVLLGRAMTQPAVMGDELVYSGLAKGFALEGLPLFRGELDLAHSMLYPLLLSAAYVVADNGARAYEAVKVINAIAVTSAAVPGYLIARRVVSPGLGLVVAAFVAFEPWTAYASLTMTESLFLPAFTTFALVLAHALERPTLRLQLALLLAMVVLIAIRPQAFVLVAAVVAAIAIHGVRTPPVGDTVRAYALLLIGLAVGGTVALVGVLTGANSPGAGVADLAKSFLDPVGLVTWSLWTLAVYELALGVVGLVLFPFALVALLGAPLERTRATGLAMLTSSLALLVSVAAVSASPSGFDVLHERYLFYATPLVLVGLAYVVQEGVSAPRVAVWGVAAAAVAIAATLPADQVARANNVDSPTAAWLEALHGEMRGIPTRVVVVVLAALGAAVVLRSRSAVARFAAVAVAFVAIIGWLDYSGPFSREQARRLAWVDDALAGDGRASLVHLGYSRPDQPCSEGADREQQWLVVLTEFFNTRVDHVYHVNQEVERDHLGSPALTVGSGGVVQLDGRPFAPRHVVLDSRQPVVGRRMGRLDLASLGTEYQEGASLTIWKVDPPLRFLVHAQPLPPRADETEC